MEPHITFNTDYITCTHLLPENGLDIAWEDISKNAIFMEWLSKTAQYHQSNIYTIYKMLCLNGQFILMKN